MRTAPARLFVVITCRSCGASCPVAMTARAQPAEGNVLPIRITADRDDQAWVGLFQRAHAGPFTHRSGP